MINVSTTQETIADHKTNIVVVVASSVKKLNTTLAGDITNICIVAEEARGITPRTNGVGVLTLQTG